MRLRASFRPVLELLHRIAVSSAPKRVGTLSTALPGALLLFVLMLAGAPGCSKSPTSHELALGNCTACHTSQTQLVATAAPDEGGGETSSGEG